MIETVAHNFFRPLFNLADVDQHSRCWIDRPGEDEVDDVISTGSVPCVRLRTERAEVFSIAPLLNMQAPGSGKFEPLAHGQKHEAANTVRVLPQDGSEVRQLA